jgi:hypothetical protein
MRILQSIYPGSAWRKLGRLLSAFCFLSAVAPYSWGGVGPYFGAIGGVATLSADGGSKTTSAGLNLSSYAPSNGGALNVFAGVSVHNYVSLQLNYIWNGNDLRLNSASSGTGAFYQEDRTSSQQAVIFDTLVYFRPRRSRIRPYLATGIGVVHFSSREQQLISSGGAPALPPARFASTEPALRVHVGIDLRLVRRLDFRYSFSDTISSNEVSKNLSPPGPRGMENFQNLFGFVVRF